MPSQAKTSQGMDMEIILPAAIIILAVLAIIVFIISGVTVGFYGLFLLDCAVMLYTWKYISDHPATQHAAQAGPMGSQKVAGFGGRGAVAATPSQASRARQVGQTMKSARKTRARGRAGGKRRTTEGAAVT